MNGCTRLGWPSARSPLDKHKHAYTPTYAYVRTCMRMRTCMPLRTCTLRTLHTGLYLPWPFERTLNWMRVNVLLCSACTLYTCIASCLVRNVRVRQDVPLEQATLELRPRQKKARSWAERRRVARTYLEVGLLWRCGLRVRVRVRASRTHVPRGGPIMALRLLALTLTLTRTLTLTPTLSLTLTLSLSLEVKLSLPLQPTPYPHPISHPIPTPTPSPVARGEPTPTPHPDPGPNHNP